MKQIISLILSSAIIISVAAQKCPQSIRVFGPSDIVAAGSEVKFIVDVAGSDSLLLTYNWMVSAGSISAGQGTSIITLSLEGTDSRTATATVELGGLPPECNRTASATIEISKPVQKIIDEKYTTAAAVNKAVELFASKTGINFDSNMNMAFVYIYPSPSTTPAQLKIMKATIIKAFDKNKLLPYQYTIEEGGKKKLASFEIYLVPDGAKSPLPTSNQ